MNKNRYRIIFNKARGMLMVVADIAASGRATSSPSSGPGHTLAQRLCSLSGLSFSLLLALGCVSAQAGIVADGSAARSQRPAVLNTANGTPVINIQTPNSKGLSHNKYSQFDVNQQGVILNNAHRATQTQLGGMVTANPWLAKSEAKIILNEVSSRNPSLLNGAIEVAGRKAQVVIANPAGITCDGCGFINASRATLTTGKTQLNNGQITGYDVRRGEIVIQGRGMDSAGQDSTDIIARAVKVNAGIWAKALNVTAGLNLVDADHQNMQARQDEGNARPQLAVDVAHLGGMYAQKIRLIGTEKGVGVRNAGYIGTSAGDVVVTADGRIENSGSIYSSGNATVSATGNLDNTGIIAANSQTKISAARIDASKQSVFAAGVNGEGKAGNSGNLTLNSQGMLASHGQNVAAGTIQLQGTSVNISDSRTAGTNLIASASGNISTSRAAVSSIKTLRLSTTAGKIDNESGTLVAGKLALNASQLNNQKGTLQQTGNEDLALAFTHGIDNREGQIGSNSYSLTLNTRLLHNEQGQIAHAGEGQLHIAADTIEAAEGDIFSLGALDVKTKTLKLDNATTEAKQITVHTDTLSHRSGRMIQLGNEAMSVTATAALDNSDGTIASNGALLAQGNKLNNARGKLLTAADGDLRVLSDTGINNDAGLIQSGGTLQLNTHGSALSNRSSGETGGIISNGNLTLRTGQLDNQNGRMMAGDALAVESADLSNIAGQLQAAGNVTLNLLDATLDNLSGLIRSGKSVVLNSAGLNNQQTQAQSQGIEGQSVQINSAELDNNKGSIRAGEKLAIISKRLDNRDGLLSSGKFFEIGDNHSGQHLNINNLNGTLIADQLLALKANQLAGDGQVLSLGDMSLSLSQAFTNQGKVVADGNLTFSAGRGVINESVIKAGRILNLDAASLINNAPAEISAGENHLRIAGTFTNRGLIDGGLTHIDSASLLNSGTGRIYGNHIAIATGTLDNLAENGTAATIAAREQLNIGAGTVNNLGHGLIYSAGSVAIGGGLDDSLTATGQAAELNNHSSILESGGNISLNIRQIDNINDHLVTRTAVTERSTKHEAVLSGATQRFDWSTVDTSSKNKYGVHKAKMPDGTSGRTFFEYNYTRTVTETQVAESDPGQIIAGGSMAINSDELNNRDSRIVAGGQLAGIIGTLNNIASRGEQITTDVGKQTRWYAKKKKRKAGGTKTSQGKKKSNYKPTPVVRTIDLKTLEYRGNATIGDRGATIADRDTTSLSLRPGSISSPLPLPLPDSSTPLTLPENQSFHVDLPAVDGITPSIHLTSPDLRLPDSSLFSKHPESTATYLIETDPRFTDRQTWLSSDYMMQAFITDPDNIQKRLGDGYYEQRLIREQVIALTGQRYLGETRSDEEQFRMLMNNGIDAGQKWGLKPGVALSAEQMSRLTSDIVWMVSQRVQLPDGSTQQVLVPQVYAKVQPGDLDGSGALLAGRQVRLSVGQDLTNSGSIAGRDVTQLTAEDLMNSGLISGDQVSLLARNDITLRGGTVQARDSLIASAGRDFTSSSTLRGTDAERYTDRVAGLYVQNDGGQLGLQAANNISLTATGISNAGDRSLTQILAGNDLTLGTLTTTHSEYGSWGKGTDRSLTQSTETGTQINGGDIRLQAGHDLNARAATVSARNDLTVAAGHDITLTQGEAAFHLTENSRQTAKGALSKKTIITHDEITSRTAVGSRLDGNTVSIQAGHDLTVQGSGIASTGDLSLAAGNNLSLLDAVESRQESHLHQEKKSGLSGTGGIGVTYGKNEVKTTDTAASLTSAGSTVGSINGSVAMTAGNSLTVKGSDVLAGRDISLTGSEVNLLAADNQSSQTHKVEQKQSGLTLALSGAVGSALNTAVTSANTASNEDSGRLAALNGVKAALSGVQAYQGTQLADAQADPGSMAGINLSWGSQSSTSEQTQTNNYTQGSSVQAGNNLSVSATGSDIHVQGSQLQAGNDLSLSAQRDVLLDSALNTRRLDGKNESHGSSVGVGINFGQGANGLSISASGNKGKGHERGNGTTHSETTLDAGNTVSIVSGRDTALTGAQVSGSQVSMDVGRNLTLVSQQDSDNYDSKQTSVSGGVSGSMAGGSASVNLSRDKMHSTYDSVIEQTGIFAGQGGFDITVGEHTQLDGAVIGSTGSADSTTKSALSEGSLTVRDQDKQLQDVADLSRDVAHANQTLSPSSTRRASSGGFRRRS